VAGWDIVILMEGKLSKEQMQQLIMQFQAREKAQRHVQRQDQELLEDGVVVEEESSFMRRLVRGLFVLIGLMVVFQYKGEQFMKLARFQSQADHYHVLNVDPTASQEDIKRAYKALVRRLHPDKCGDSCKERFEQVREAWEVLGQADSRAEFDNSLGTIPKLPTRALSLDEESFDVLRFSRQIWLVEVID
jgi:DnaJ-domain-containing protein 1